MPRCSAAVQRRSAVVFGSEQNVARWLRRWLAVDERVWRGWSVGLKKVGWHRRAGKSEGLVWNGGAEAEGNV